MVDSILRTEPVVDGFHPKQNRKSAGCELARSGSRRDSIDRP
jgi:hypothetical protein